MEKYTVNFTTHNLLQLEGLLVRYISDVTNVDDSFTRELLIDVIKKRVFQISKLK